MTRIINIFLSIGLIFNILTADVAAVDISFLDLPLNSSSASLGNTFLSDLGNPSNLLLNPSNIWFGDRVNPNKTLFKRIFLRSSLSNYQIIGNDYFNIMGSFQFGNGITIGGGYIGINQSDIEHYDNNANYLGEISHNQKAYVMGSAIRISGINIGMSGAYIETDFSKLNGYGEQDAILVSSIGLSMINKSINIEKEELWAQILIPTKISFHVLSRNIVSDISTNISIAKNSLYRNVIGFRFDNDIQASGLKIPTYFLVDYKSNNGFTNEVIDLGWGVNNLFDLSGDLGIGDLSFNMGIQNLSFNQFSWGLNYSVFDFIVGYASIGNAWGGQTSVLSFKYFYDKN